MRAAIIALFLLIVTLLGGCVQSKESISTTSSSISDDTGDQNETEEQRIKRIQEEYKATENLSPHDYYSYKWGEYPEEFICVPDRETAIQIATTILRTNVIFEDYYALNVKYDDVHEIWMVFFQHKSWFGEIGDGACVALQKQDGKVLKITTDWVVPDR